MASTIITASNYVDVAAQSYVGIRRLELVANVIDAAFEMVVSTGDAPGTYACDFAGTIRYTKSGSTYTFTPTNCESTLGSQRVVIRSGSLVARDPMITATGSAVFLTSASITVTNAVVEESGAPSTFSGTIDLSSTVTSQTTARATTTGASLSVVRAGRTDSYSAISLVADVTLSSNAIASGTFRIESPREPAAMVVQIDGPSAIYTTPPTDPARSQVQLDISNSSSFRIRRTEGGTLLSEISIPPTSGEFAAAIARALQ